MLTVLHVIDSGGFYGAEHVIINLMQAQREQRIKPVLLSIGDLKAGSKEIEKEAIRRGIDVIPLRFRNGLNLWGSLYILDHSKKLRANIIHSHGYKANILLGIIPRRCRTVPVVTTLHGWTSIHALTKIWLYEWLDALAINNLDRIVAVSTRMRDHPRLSAFRNSPLVIRNGIPPLHFDVPPPGFPPSELTQVSRCGFAVLSIGRLSPEKGFDILIDALASVVSKGIDARLVLIGEGSQRGLLQEAAAEKQVSERVCLLGYREEAFRFIPLFDVFVLPSLTEGLPLTLLEAMQAGVPVVATRVGEIPDILAQGRYGYLVKPGDANALAEEMEAVYRFREAGKAKALRGREWALREFSIDRMAREYAALYQDTIRHFSQRPLKKPGH